MTKKEGKLSLSEVQALMPTIETYVEQPLIPVGGGIVLVKDLHHRFVASNMVFSRFSGINPYKLQGLCDFDMPWAERSDIYTNHEDAILSGETYNVLEPLPGVVKAFLHTSKEIIYDRKGIPAGTTATAIIMNGAVDFSNITGTAKLVKVSPYKGVNLTANEAKVLFFVLKGMKRSKIAEVMNMSLANYDYYLRNIKLKFHTDSIVKLIETCIERGYHENFPFQIVT
ncbi:helix-turn-helix transcriptional regulator (plasmid) [Serratia marcescens]|uniref:helix-turn-helix transcriptional regulator n=1 Tax=Serratia marcescens TaxID=615 RepID=UPI003FA799EC